MGDGMDKQETPQRTSKPDAMSKEGTGIEVGKRASLFAFDKKAEDLRDTLPVLDREKLDHLLRVAGRTQNSLNDVWWEATSSSYSETGYSKTGNIEVPEGSGPVAVIKMKSQNIKEKTDEEIGKLQKAETAMNEFRNALGGFRDFENRRSTDPLHVKKDRMEDMGRNMEVLSQLLDKQKGMIDGWLHDIGDRRLELVKIRPDLAKILDIETAKITQDDANKMKEYAIKLNEAVTAGAASLELAMTVILPTALNYSIKIAEDIVEQKT